MLLAWAPAPPTCSHQLQISMPIATVVLAVGATSPTAADAAAPVALRCRLAGCGGEHADLCPQPLSWCTPISICRIHGALLTASKRDGRASSDDPGGGGGGGSPLPLALPASSGSDHGSRVTALAAGWGVRVGVTEDGSCVIHDPCTASPAAAAWLPAGWAPSCQAPPPVPILLVAAGVCQGCAHTHMG